MPREGSATLGAWTRLALLTLSPYLFLFTSICCSVLSTLMQSFSSVSMRSLVCCTSLARQSHCHTAGRDPGTPEGTTPGAPQGCGHTGDDAVVIFCLFFLYTFMYSQYS